MPTRGSRMSRSRRTMEDIMVSTLHHRHHRDQQTDECILLREEDNTSDFLYSFSPDSSRFYHVWYVLLPERDDTNFVYRDRFFCK